MKQMDMKFLRNWVLNRQVIIMGETQFPLKRPFLQADAWVQLCDMFKSQEERKGVKK